jgi:hypothetical protein
MQDPDKGRNDLWREELFQGFLSSVRDNRDHREQMKRGGISTPISIYNMFWEQPDGQEELFTENNFQDDSCSSAKMPRRMMQRGRPRRGGIMDSSTRDL